jgi:hypothetical protein
MLRVPSSRRKAATNEGRAQEGKFLPLYDLDINISSIECEARNVNYWRLDLPFLRRPHINK